MSSLGLPEADPRYPILLGIGGNLGKPIVTFRKAVQLLRSHGVHLVRASSLYQTAAWGAVPQPDYLNAILQVNTSLEGRPLLRALLDVERALGRDRSTAERWGPRPIDLDLLTYGKQVLSAHGMTVPHPRITQRKFVLVPLCEILPYACHPVLDLPYSDLLNRCIDDGEVKKTNVRW